MISLAVWIQYTNVTDRQTDTGRQLVPRLRIVTRLALPVIHQNSSTTRRDRQTNKQKLKHNILDGYNEAIVNSSDQRLSMVFDGMVH